MSTPFDDLAAAYDAIVDWPRRLAHEEGLYREVLARTAGRRVLDAACGTGRHAAMFHGWGLDVEGADLSPAMVQRCREQHGEPAGLRWVVRGFDEPVEHPGSYDLAICVGNSLALAPSEDVVAEAVRQLMAAVRPGGVLVLGVLNLWRLPDGPLVWQKCQQATLPGGSRLILKGVHRAGDRGFVDLVVTDPSMLSSPARSESLPFLGLEVERLAAMAREAGATSVQMFGGFKAEPYDRQRSQDLIVVATR